MKIKKIILPSLIFMIPLVIWGIFNKKCAFLTVTLYDLLSLFFSILIAYIGILITLNVSEKKNDLRRKNDKIDNEIIKMQEFLQSDILRLKSFKCHEDSKKNLMSQISKLKNKISFLKKYCTEKNFEDDFSSIDIEVVKYSAVLDYINNEELVIKNTIKLVQSLDDIEQYLCNIRLKI